MTALLEWLLARLTGPLGKYLAWGVAAVALGAAVWIAIDQHDDRVRAELVAKEKAETAAETIATLEADAKRINAALSQVQAAADARSVALAPARKAIANAAPSSACAQSVAVRAALDGLRRPPAGH